jgi:hypothetical protein
LFNSPFIIPVLALAIPIVAIVLRHMRRWQEIDVQAAEAELDLRRRFRGFDEIDRRVGDIERYITSPEFDLNRQLRKLGEKP